MSDGIAVAFNGHLHIKMDYSEVRYLYGQWGIPLPEDDPNLGCDVQIGKYCTMIRTWGREGKEEWLDYSSSEMGKARMIYIDSEDPRKNRTLWARNFIQQP